MNFSAIRDFVCRLVTVAAIVATAVSCSEYEFGGSTDTDEGLSGEVIIAIPELSVPRVGTRVAIDADKEKEEGAVKTLSLKWTEDDAFALWASRTDDGEPVGDGHKNMKFSYHGGSKYQDGKVYFASYKVPEMSAGEYSYTAFYPYQEDETKVDRVNNRVTYTIPTEQSGLYNGSCDIMSAVAEFGEALAINFYQDINLTFKHQTHALKITVPEEKNGFGDDKEITRIRIEFSKPVAGDLTFDTVTTDPDFSGITENYIDVRFTKEHPFKVGEPFWVFIAPVDMSDGVVKFTAFGGDDEKYQSEPSTGLFKDLTRGVITPVNLGIGEAFSITWFEYDVDYSQLGEEVEMLHLTISDENQHFANGSKTLDVARDEEGGKFKFSFRTQELQSWDRVEIIPVYESKNAIVSEYAESLIIDDYIPDAHNEKNAQAPYLFFEDFSLLNENGSYNGDDSNDARNEKTAHEFLDGWSGARIRLYANTSIRVACYCYSGAFSAGTLWYGRVDSAPLRQLKDNANVNVRLSFDYGTDEENAGTFTSWLGLNCYLGLVDVQGGINSESNIGTYISDPVIVSSDRGATSTNLPNNLQSKLENCNKLSRISWKTYPTGTPSGGGVSWSHNTIYLYIDNRKVSIVKN